MTHPNNTLPSQTDAAPGSAVGLLRKALVWIPLLGLLAILGWRLMDNVEGKPIVGEPAPAYDLFFFPGYEHQGETHLTHDAFEGQITVINFWASWCVECRAEADELEANYQAFKDQGVVFIGIAYADAEPNSLAHLEEFGVSYPQAPDFGGNIGQAFDVTGTPETYVIDRDGKIVYTQIGRSLDNALADVLASLTAEGG